MGANFSFQIWHSGCCDVLSRLVGLKILPIPLFSSGWCKTRSKSVSEKHLPETLSAVETIHPV